MSSAALQQQQQHQQQLPQQSPSSQQQQQQQSQYAHAAASDRYAAGLPTSAASSRHAARTGSESASLPNSPQQPPFSSPTTMGSPRGQANTATSGIPVSSSYSNYPLESTTPTSVSNASLPIRTAAQPTTPTHAANYDARGNSSRSSQSQAGYGGEADRRGDSERRRAEPRSPREEQQQPGSGKSQRTRNAPTSSRSTTAIGQPPMGTDLPRENSHVINRIVVDDPQADLAREEMRKAEGRPQPPGTSMDMSGGPVQTAAPARRQEHLRQTSSSRKEVKFGDYILGQTLGEGEFGKVKMGWKKDSTVQVAIKLIRKESLAGNNTRLPKIYREIAILRELEHPNIVRLHEFVETERHMGIILEYASGGELFDFILTQRYLRDKDARRLFAQLVSGVGYLHQKGIVHRDLKLENLLLDRNKHIIITDFGFANTFDANDELGEEIENRLHDKSFVKAKGLDKFINRQDGRDGGQYRRGDLMQTSCGSPCYAAPELVVSDGLYTGRKVDVWSCGVILYAMLAGYLPFDDDPANPEGDNINLLYKYITSTPLTFPEYVTPHARDLLRRILVPDPRKRADLFEVARHSWLSEYTHVVGFIGSKVKSEKDIAASAMQHQPEASYLGRSASVREPNHRGAAGEHRTSANVPRHIAAASIGGDEASDIRRAQQQRDAKRRTVQLEYVAPNHSTARGEVNNAAAPSPTVPVAAGPTVPKTRARPEVQGPVEVAQTQRRQEMAPPPSRPFRDQRTASESTTGYGASTPASASRPGTGGALGGSARLPSRGNSYSQPSAAQPTNTTAQGSFSQPKSSSGYIISGPSQVDQAGHEASARPASQTQPNRMSGHFAAPAPGQGPTRPGGHKRSSTLGSFTDKILSRSNSKRTSQQDSNAAHAEKRDRRYPPVSMKNAMPYEEAQPRPSSDSRRPSFGFSRKASRERDSSVQGRRNSRRFSLLPSNFSVNNLLGRKDHASDANAEEQSDTSQQYRPSRPQSKGMGFGRSSRSPSKSTLNSTSQHNYEGGDASRVPRSSGFPQSRGGSGYDKALPPAPGPTGSRGQVANTPPPVQRKQFRDDGYGSNRLDQESAERYYNSHQDAAAPGPQPDQYNPGGSENAQYDEYDENDLQQQTSLRPQQRKFGDAYDHGHGGSSSATRRVMDFFRRRGKDRSEL